MENKQIQFIEVYNPSNGIRIYALGDMIFNSKVGGFRDITIPCVKHTDLVLDENEDKIFTAIGTEIIPFYDTKYLERKRKAELDNKQRLVGSTKLRMRWG